MNKKDKNISRIIAAITIVIAACIIVCWVYIIKTNAAQRKEILREMGGTEEIGTPTAIHNLEDSCETGLFEDYAGSFVLSGAFSEEYILSLVSCDYNKELYYPVPDFAPASVITRWRDRFAWFKKSDDFEGFNKSVYWSFYHISFMFDIDYYREDGCAIPLAQDMQAFSDARKYWIYWNIHEQLGDVEYTSIYPNSYQVEDNEEEDESKSYWEEALEKQQEDAARSAGVGDFIMYYGTGTYGW